MRRAFIILGTLGLLTVGACSDWSNPIAPYYAPIDMSLPVDTSSADVPHDRPKLDP